MCNYALTVKVVWLMTEFCFCKVTEGVLPTAVSAQGDESGSQKKMVMSQSTARPVLKDNCPLLNIGFDLQGLILPRIQSNGKLPPCLSQIKEDTHTESTQKHQALTLVLTSLTGQVRHLPFFSKCSF